MEAPIGSIVAFAGGTGELRADFDTTTGWMLCDGRSLDGNDPNFQPLFDAIRFAWGGDADTNHFNIPDLRGFFLRGVEREQGGRRDPDGDGRPASNPGGHSGRSVGSQEGFATAMPRNAFRADTSGAHTHPLNFELNASRDVGDQFNTVAFPAPGEPFTPLQRGAHAHEIIGGDRETRPLNCYVHWIIRWQP